jgi:SAM-dependent methyltransferase
MNLDLIPFAAPARKDEDHPHQRNRVGLVGDFIGADFSTVSLNIGSSDAFSRALGIRDSTFDTDFNVEIQAPYRSYDLILCSEVYEHVFNPQLMMTRIYELLKPGGVCVLSTPIVSWTGVYQTPLHFVEYKPEKLRAHFQYVGFEIVDFKRYSLFDPSFIFTGVRPCLRKLFHKNQLWKLRKPYRTQDTSTPTKTI